MARRPHSPPASSHFEVTLSNSSRPPETRSATRHCQVPVVLLKMASEIAELYFFHTPPSKKSFTSSSRYLLPPVPKFSFGQLCFLFASLPPPLLRYICVRDSAKPNLKAGANNGHMHPHPGSTTPRVKTQQLGGEDKLLPPWE